MNVHGHVGTHLEKGLGKLAEENGRWRPPATLGPGASCAALDGWRQEVDKKSQEFLAIMTQKGLF